MQKYERGAQGNVRGEREWLLLIQQEKKWEIPFPKFRNGKGVKQIDSQRGSPLYKLFGAGWVQKGVGGIFLKIRPHSCV